MQKIQIALSQGALAYAHWIAFGVLGILGGRMIAESFKKEGISEISQEEISLSLKKMLPLAIATSIDAMAVGVTFAALKVNIIVAAIMIGAVTLVISMFGVKIGNTFGAKFKSKAEIAGGVILILLGVKILAENLLL